MTPDIFENAMLFPQSLCCGQGRQNEIPLNESYFRTMFLCEAGFTKLCKGDQHNGEGETRMRKNSFTMIELLTVISVIVILVAMLLPALQKAREKAQSTHCVNNLHEFYLAHMSYGNDYKNFWLYDTTQGIPGHIKGTKGSYCSIGKLYVLKYLSTLKIFLCPSEHRDRVVDPKDPDAVPLVKNTWGYECSYMYMPITSNHVATLCNGNEKSGIKSFKRIDGSPAGAALMFDTPGNDSKFTGNINHESGSNTLCAAGYVIMIPCGRYYNNTSFGFNFRLFNDPRYPDLLKEIR